MDYFIRSEKIVNTLIKVKSEILKDVLNEFLFTSLRRQNIKLYSNSKIFYTYLKQNNYYQISTYRTKDEKPILELDLINYYINNSSENTFNLCICDDLFILYKNSELYYYQKKSNDMSTEEIKLFLENKFSILILQKTLITNSEINKMKLEFNKKNFKSKLLYIKKTSLNLFYYFKFLILLLTLFIFATYLLKSENKDEITLLKNEYNRLETQKEYKNYVSAKLLNVFLEIKKLNMKINKLVYEDGKFLVNITSSKRNSLYVFIKSYKKSVINSITMNGGNYDMDAKIYF